MIEPIIGFSAFFLIIYIVIRIANKSRKEQYIQLIDEIENQILLKIEQTKSSITTFGLNNRDFLFNNCDLYLTQNAIVILGYTKGSFFKQLSKPIILTSDVLEYSAKFPFAYIMRFNKINFENNIMGVYFGEKGLTKTEVVIKLKSLKENEIDKFKEQALKNCW
ncbi:hypothetical protein [Flavobacterium terrisoli]|uniref:hypothetical protein n=1 Tax=Flavobacterium terrisoli TaxID=3242195 RepID=UPI002543188C|nr:hypothetical protein [Flavobacterium buctense]